MLVHGPWNPPLAPERAAWPEGTLSRADEARFAGYADALAFFEGDQWPKRARRSDPSQLVFNYARALIRKTASYVFPGPVGFSVLPEGDAQEAANRAERRLADLRDALDLMRLDLALSIDSAVLRDAAMKVTWDHEAASPRVVAADPGTLAVRWAPDDPRTVEEVTQGYALSGFQIARIFQRGDVGGLDGERVYPVIERWTPERWRVLVAGQLVHDLPNPYGWIPYIVVANDPRPLSFWGTSDLTDLMGVCRELNRRMTVLSHVLELSGAPIAVLENVDGSEGIRVGPGAKWELPEGSRAYLLDLLQGGEVEMHLRYVDLLFRMLHDLSETPRTAFGDSGRNLSGAALEVEFSRWCRRWGGSGECGMASLPFVTGCCWTCWSTSVARISRGCAGRRPCGHLSCRAIRTARCGMRLPSSRAVSRAGAVRNAAALVESGIQSRRGAMVSLGEADPDAELARIREENAG